MNYALETPEITSVLIPDSAKNCEEVEVSNNSIGNEENQGWKKNLAAFSGNFLEWYDFSVYGYFSDVIGAQFFPRAGKTQQLVLSFVVFGVAFLGRPIGSILLGQVGDKYGTKNAIEIAILCMGCSSFLLGCLPPYSLASWTAPALLILMRTLQGVSVGGQSVSALLFSIEGEQARKHEAFQFTLVSMSGHLGFIFGNLLSAVLRSTLTRDQLNRWGWRIPFWLGSLVCTSGLYLKYKVPNHHNHEQTSLHHLKRSFQRQNWIPMLCFAAVVSVEAVMYYLAFTWAAIWMNRLLKPPIKESYFITAAASFLSLVIQPLSGIILDKIKRKEFVVLVTIMLSGIFFPIGLSIIQSTRNPYISCSVLSFVGLICTFERPAVLCYFHTKFAPATKVTTMSFAYNISLSLFGGMCPALATALFKVNPIAPGFLVSAVALLGLFGLVVAYAFSPSLNDAETIITDSTDGDITVDSETVTSCPKVLPVLLQPLLEQNTLPNRSL